MQLIKALVVKILLILISSDKMHRPMLRSVGLLILQIAQYSLTFQKGCLMEKVMNSQYTLQ
ncbi:uncharacterized protein METZ01_LOCUS317454 [marine metagenome]|uniref:Uncharacterized protein n=1 Tax=marine metagenome TaxID=408172 RepID=A0A382NVB9_9ZZZZ